MVKHVIKLAAIAALLELRASPIAAQGPDFDNDGFDDLAIGAPLEDLSGVVSAGAVNVIYGTPSGLAEAGDQLWHQDSPNVLDPAECCDQFGRALAWGDFDNDGFDDLAIGAPAEGVGDASGAGAVNVLYGSATGLNAAGNQFWHRNSVGILETAQAGDGFGRALAAGDFNGDGFDDLAIGVPTDEVASRSGSITNAGSAHVIYGSAAGLTDVGDQIWNQDSPGILDAAETDDGFFGEQFGSSLAAGDFDNDGFADLAVGVRLEDVGQAGNAGAANVIYGSATGLAADGNQFWNQDSPNIPEIAETVDLFSSALAAGDFDDDGFDDLAIGVEQETVVASEGVSGAVHVLYGGPIRGLSDVANQLWTQTDGGIEDVAEPGEDFGTSLAVGDFDKDGVHDLAVGVSQERSVGRGNVYGGAVNVIYGTNSGLSAAGDQFWNQDSPGILETAASGDFFGYALGAGDFDGDGSADLAVGVLSEDLAGAPDAGAVNVLYGSFTGLSEAGDQLWHQDSAGILGAAEDGDEFGYAFPAH